MIVKLGDRVVIKISGRDSKKFLQGLITNDVNKLDKEGVIFSAMLNPKGRFLFDFFIYQSGNELLIDIDKKFADDFIKKLSLYKLNSDVTIEKSNLLIYADTENSLKDLVSYKDPRNDQLGNRVLAQENLEETSALNDYELLRIENLVADGAKDLVQEKSFILEFGYQNINAIDFDKGCYVGQELTTRTYRTGVIRKGLRFLKNKEKINEEIIEQLTSLMQGKLVQIKLNS